MGEGWYYDFPHTHFDRYSPPDFYTRVYTIFATSEVYVFEAETDTKFRYFILGRDRWSSRGYGNEEDENVRG